jgi:hypothetical protein
MSYRFSGSSSAIDARGETKKSIELQDEKLKWYQQSKAQFILESGLNTRSFYSVTNGRHRKKLIHPLVQDEGTIDGHELRISQITIKGGLRKRRYPAGFR